MNRSWKPPSRLWNVAAYACISAALGAVILVGVWGAYRDMALVRSTALQAEVSRLRAEAIRTVGRIERRLDPAQTAVEGSAALVQPWLQEYWKRTLPDEDSPFYAAVVDRDGRVQMHSDPALVGKLIGRRWYERVIRDQGDDIFETQSPALNAGRRAYDLQVLIAREGQDWGEYHTGFDLAWFDQSVAAQRQAIFYWWALVVGAILLIVALAAASLYYLAMNSLALSAAAEQAERQREAEVGQLAAGLAHEICNPLHAIRLNLHALGRAHQGRVTLAREELAAITRESNLEIDRVDRLLRELVHFASPEKPRHEPLEVRAEVDAVVDFTTHEMQQAGVEVRIVESGGPAWIRLDRDRFRQILLNLLGNARDAAADGGSVEVEIARRGEVVTLSVSDTGPGVPERDRQRIFEPFYSTKEHGAGLGLALVRRFVEEAGGQVECIDPGGAGARFTVQFPALVPSKRISPLQKVIHS